MLNLNPSTTCQPTRGTAFYAAALKPKMQAKRRSEDSEAEPLPGPTEPDLNNPVVDPLAVEEAAAADPPSTTILQVSVTTLSEVMDNMTAGRQAERRIKQKRAEDGDHAERNKLRKARRRASKALDQAKPKSAARASTDWWPDSRRP